MKYSSMTVLKSEAEIAPEQRNKLHKLTCDAAFESYKNLFKKAANSADNLEDQYILYTRCGELGKMILSKNGFSQFAEKKKKELRSTFIILLSKMEELENVLTVKYDESNKNHSAPAATLPNNPQPPVVQDTSTVQIFSASIEARDLMRLIKEEKKSAIILDFRPDQSTSSISFKKGAILTVASIPRELIRPGLLFSALKHQVPVKERPVLTKISSYDYVVLMDTDSPQLINNEPMPSSEAGILKLALTEYNIYDKLKSTPLFMNGGFISWTLQYPVYVNRTGQNLDTQCSDILGSTIAKYQKDTSYHLDSFPDLSPVRTVQLSEPAPSLVQETRVVPFASSEAFSSTHFEINKPENIDHDLLDSKVAASKVCPVPERPPIPAEFGSDPHPASSLSSPKLPRLAAVPQSSHSKKPDFDRGSKPDDIRQVSQQSNGVALSPSMPSLDRSTKPTFSPDAERALFTIYKHMADNIEINGTRGKNTPGQTGLYNMGNTCFMSACLQALFQTPGLVKLFTKDTFIKSVNMHNKLGTRGVISATFSALVDNAWSGVFIAFRPKRFLDLFAEMVNEMLMNGEQQDASEFYMMLLATLHEDTSQVVKPIPPVQDYCGKRIRDEAADFDRRQLKFSCSPISRLMHPRAVAEVTCAKCKRKSVKFEDINIIQVGLPSASIGRTSLVDCLHRSFSITDLDGLWDCPDCKKPRSATQKLSLWNLPDVIVIHLLRFSISGGDYVKNDISVVFDTENLDMSGFLHASADRNVDATFRLYSVTNHRGRLNSGHYTAYCRHLRSCEWLRFDDETVSRASASNINFSDAYILYFKRRTL